MTIDASVYLCPKCRYELDPLLDNEGFACPECGRRSSRIVAAAAWRKRELTPLESPSIGWTIGPTLVFSGLLALVAVLIPYSGLTMFGVMAYFFGIPILVLITGGVLVQTRLRLSPHNRASLPWTPLVGLFMLNIVVYIITLMFVIFILRVAG